MVWVCWGLLGGGGGWGGGASWEARQTCGGLAMFSGVLSLAGVSYGGFVLDTSQELNGS